MNDGNQPKDAKPGMNPREQTGEEHGSIKGRQRGEDDFKGKGDTARGSEPAQRGASTQRG